MIYLSWAACYEGTTDDAYFDVLLPRLLEEMSLAEAVRPLTVPLTPAVRLGRGMRSADAIAEDLCANKDAFYIVFMHADTGGRAQQNALHRRSASVCEIASHLCNWPSRRCITINPRHETEAWALADPVTVARVLGFSGEPAELDLPLDASAAERLPDPKATLASAARIVRGRRGRSGGGELLTAIAQGQSLEALRGAASFRAFEKQLREALRDLGHL
jgi:hypothetical protein